MGAILESYSAIANALSYLHSDISEKGDTRLHANNLLQKIEKLEFVFMLQLNFFIPMLDAALEANLRRKAIV